MCALLLAIFFAAYKLVFIESKSGALANDVTDLNRNAWPENPLIMVALVIEHGLGNNLDIDVTQPMVSSTARAPSISCRSLCRQSSEIRTGCANQRPSGSVRGEASTRLTVPRSPSKLPVRKPNRGPPAQRTSEAPRFLERSVIYGSSLQSDRLSPDVGQVDPWSPYSHGEHLLYRA